MLKMRSSQIEALEAASLDHFFNRIVTHLKQELWGSVEAISDEDLLEIARNASEQARKLNFRSEGEVVRYVEVYVLSGGKLGIAPRDQGALRILRNPRLVADWPKFRPCVLEAWRLANESRV